MRLQRIGQLVFNRAGCPNRTLAAIGNRKPIGQVVPIGRKTTCSNVLHAARMRHDVRRHIFLTQQRCCRFRTRTVRKNTVCRHMVAVYMVGGFPSIHPPRVLLAIGSQSGKGQSGIGQSKSIGQSGKMTIGRCSQSGFSANRVWHRASTA